MSSVAFAGGRRVRAVVSAMARGVTPAVSSISFGTVLVGALMVWMAAALFSMDLDSARTGMAGAVVVETPVGLAGFAGEDFDGTDDTSGVRPRPRWTRLGGAQSSASGSLPVSTTHRAGRQATPSADIGYADPEMAPVPWATGTGHGAAARTAGATSSTQTTPSSERASSQGQADPMADALTGLFDRLARAWSGGGSSVGTSSKSLSSGSGSVAPSMSRRDQRARGAAEAVDSAQSQPRGVPTVKPAASRGSTQPAAGQRPGGAGRARAGESMGGVVDLVSGIVGTIAGKKAGAQTRQGLSGIADQVSSALRAGHRINTSSGASDTGTGGISAAAQPGTRERATHTNTGGPALAAGGHSHQPDCAGESSCAEIASLPSGRKPTTQAARGPPAGPSRAALQTKIDGTQLNEIVDGAMDLTEGLLGGLAKLVDGGKGGKNGGTGARGELADSIRETTNKFVSDLLELVGTSSGGGQRGQNARSGQSFDEGAGGFVGGVRRGSAGQVEQVLSGVTDMVSGLVTVVAGKKAGARARQALTSAADDVLAALRAAEDRRTGGQGMTGSGGGGQNGGGQDTGWALNNDGQFAGTECQGDAECALTNGTLKTRQPGSLGGRAPPELLPDPSNPDRPYRLASWRGDNSNGVNQALNDRLAAIVADKAVRDAKTELDAKKITQPAYDEKVSAQKALATKADQSMGQLDPDDSKLINDTITGHQNLATAKRQLDEAHQQLDAKKISQADYDKQAAAYNTQRRQVDELTARLHDTTGHNSADWA
uniref:hypothetical protein n=1 Tax=Pseudonocardia acaciae TaxID=551276 RepID=UPI0012ED9BD0